MTWPKLSVQLTGPRHPGACQSCGATGENLQLWREHDANDQPTYTVVVLCAPCAGRLIEPHPRLYSLLHRFAPFPGVMALCLDCRHRDGTACRSPKAKFNGGPGLEVLYPEPTRVHAGGRAPGAGGRPGTRGRRPRATGGRSGDERG
jgi:hypothetical protein